MIAGIYRVLSTSQEKTLDIRSRANTILATTLEKRSFSSCPYQPEGAGVPGSPLGRETGEHGGWEDDFEDM